MRPFNKTTATLVRPHPFSTLCPTPLGNSPVCPVLKVTDKWQLTQYFVFSCCHVFMIIAIWHLVRY